MLKRLIAMLLAALLVQAFCLQSASAKSKEEKRAELTQKVRAEISKLGVGRDARIEVTLRDRTKLAGYVSELRDNSLVVFETKTGATTSVAYADVTNVKGHNLSTGAKIGIGIGIGVAIVVIALAIWWRTDGWN